MQHPEHSKFFVGRTALVTGGSRGIGKAIAYAFARAGAHVAVTHRRAGGRSLSGGRKLCEDMEAMGRKALLLQADMADRNAIREAVRQVEAETGRLDFLILNAARAPFKPVERLLHRELLQLVNVNYLGNIFCIQEALSLLEASGGKIVFISSLGSRFHVPSYPLGHMKAAMEAVVRDCSESFRDRGVRVNGVCGGVVKTDSFRLLKQHLKTFENIPDHLTVPPEEVASVVLFLCSPASESIRGQILVVDRGLGNGLGMPRGST